ncbi:MAG: prohibitin family protein [Bacteroidales bacterium]|nr:prohibitin family protein [Bacteroidales bacterium]
MAQEELNFKKIVPIAILVVIVIVVIAFGSRMVTTIEAGYAGVLFRPFSGGLNTEKTYGEGFHLIAPWNKMYVYEVRQQEIAEEMNVLSSNGLEISVDVSIWYQPVYSEIGLLHGRIGMDYLKRIVVPGLRSSTRSVIGRYTPEDIYSTKRDLIQDEIFGEITAILADKYVQVNRVLIRSIVLPATIKQAIESKLKQEQESLEYEFRLIKAEKEAERQRIDADGKANANRILSASLTDKILLEKGIQATLELANSPNTKVIVIGNSENGLPIILGDSK